MKVQDARPYRMTARAESAERTAYNILQATVDVFWEQPTTDVSLDEIAARAGVSARTVLRRFGSKEALVTAAVQWAGERVATQRGRAPVGDVEGAVATLLDHYEEYGDRVMRLLAAESDMPSLRLLVESGRHVHVQWCRTVFAPCLTSGTAADRRRRLAQTVAICDVYTWKLLRRDAGLSRRQTEIALVEMLSPLMKES